MTNLPIASKLEPSGNATNTAQAFIAGDAQYQASFSALLAQQIGDLDLPTPTLLQTEVRIDAKPNEDQLDILTAPDQAMDQLAATVDISANPAGEIAALLSQLPPVPDKTQVFPTEPSLTENAALYNFQESTGKVINVQDKASESASEQGLPDIAENAWGNGLTPAPADTASLPVSSLPAILPVSGNQATALPTPLQHTKATSGNLQAASGKVNTRQGQIAETLMMPVRDMHEISGTPTKIMPGQSPDAAGELKEHAIPKLQGAELAINQPMPIQPSGTQISAAGTSPAQAHTMSNISSSSQTVATPLDSSNWADDFSQKIVWTVTQQSQTAQLHLNPPDLGPLNVQLKIADNQATILFTSPHSSVREAVENALPKLRDILADNGITLGNASVGDQSTQDRNSGGTMNQEFTSATPREIFNVASKNMPGSPAIISQQPPTRRHHGMIDTFA